MTPLFTPLHALQFAFCLLPELCDTHTILELLCSLALHCGLFFFFSIFVAVYLFFKKIIYLNSV